MSYKGYVEYLCENGHYYSQDAYESDIEECLLCKAHPAFIHQVDETNGMDYEDSGTLPAEKEVTGFEDDWHIDHHGNKFATKIFRYQPAKGSTWRPVIKAE